MIKDYYQILGVDRDVDAETLKKTYRTLAQEHHPDHNDGAEDAEEKFKEISEAYSVLSDPDKRQVYDMTGSVSGSGGFRTTGDPCSMFFGGRSPFGVPRPNPPMRGQSIQISLEITLADALLGAETHLEYQLHSACSSCEGRGGTDMEMCDACNGRGFIQQQQGSMFIQHGCDQCDAQGQKIKTPCSPCAGRGIIPETKGIKLSVPAGVKQGNTMRLAGQGGVGFNGGPRGDVMVVVNINYPDMSKFDDKEKEQLKELLAK